MGAARMDFALLHAASALRVACPAEHGEHRGDFIVARTPTRVNAAEALW